MLNQSLHVCFDGGGAHHARRVLIVSNGFLLDESINNLLASRSDLDVSKLLFTDEDSLFITLYSLQPEVVIIDRSISCALTRCPKQAISNSIHNDFKLMIVGVASNIIDVYEGNWTYKAHSRVFMNLL